MSISAIEPNSKPSFFITILETIAAFFASYTLSQWQSILSIILTLISIGYFIVRTYFMIKNGKSDGGE